MNGVALDLRGQHRGAVEVIDRAGTTWDGRALWRCFCHACKRYWTMRGTVLARRGERVEVKSCGCLRGGAGGRVRRRGKAAT